jgi:CRISPR-associated RAMP protein (TIGR02581 family)
MFDQFSNRLTVQGWLVAQTALRVGAGRATEPVGNDLPVMRDALERPFIPGASFKGTLRARAESLIRAVVPGQRYGACLPTGEEADRCIPNTAMADARRQARVEGWRDAQMADWVWDHACLVCRTFGSPWLASHVQVKDLAVDDARWFGQFQVRDGVAIDRDTETAAEKKLYNYEVVPADTRFHCHLVIENAEDWQRGMLWLALQPFIRGEMSIGGFRSRGLGQVKLLGYRGEDLPALNFFSLQGANPVDRLVGYLSDAKQGGEEVGDDVLARWVEAFKGRLMATRQVALQEGRDAQATV